MQPEISSLGDTNLNSYFSLGFNSNMCVCPFAPKGNIDSHGKYGPKEQYCQMISCLNHIPHVMSFDPVLIIRLALDFVFGKCILKIV